MSVSINRHHRTKPNPGLLILSFLLLSACGITAPRGNVGFANLDSPGINDTDRTMALSLGPTALRFAARFVEDAPETQALLRSLDGVRIRIYEVEDDGDTDRIARNFERMGGKLHSDGWNPVMLVREQDELVQMFVKSSGEGLQGLTIVSADGEEIIVVNVMGDIRPALYGDVMLALNIDNAPQVTIAAADG